ncbi:MAG: sulfatase [bacterium]
MKLVSGFLAARLALLLAALLVAGTGCARRPPGRNVLLVTLDTTRPDRLGVYGRPDARTPYLDRLARRGAMFEDAVCDVPVTLPSHTTIMTGEPALAHGVRYNGDFKVTDAAKTLAETFTERGYDTAAFVSSLILDARMGLAQGFRVYDDHLAPGYVVIDSTLYPKQLMPWLPKADRRADGTVDAAIAWLARKARTPLFLWVHLYDPHFPYDPPRPWARTAVEPYLAEIQFTDRQVGRLLRVAEDRGLLENAVVLAMADHGEGLEEHREDSHGIFVYDDTIRIPMIFRAPGRLTPSTVREGLARTIDVAPTLLDLAGRAEPLGLGESLVPALEGKAAPADTVAYLESIKTRLFFGGSGLKGLRSENAKFVWARQPELYDLAADPGETRNLATERPDATARWKLALEGVIRDVIAEGRPSAEAVHPDEAMLEGLRSLGYLGGSGAKVEPVSLEKEMGLTGHDPKDLVDVSLAVTEIQNGFYERGERKLQRFFATARRPDHDPDMARLWAAAHQDYAKIWMVRGDYDRAAEEYGLAAAADSTYELAGWSRVYALNLARRHVEAEKESRAFVARWPRSSRLGIHRALAMAFLGRTDEARSILEQVVRESAADTRDARSARWYLERIGGPREEAALAAYLESERARSAASSGEID